MKICIDAGHNYSQFNTGASGFGLREQDVTFYIATELRNICEKHYIDVVMTREYFTANLGTDNGSAINARWKLANQKDCDLFISIHCNAGGGKGTETLVNSAEGISYKLAKSVQKSIVSLLGTIDRGVKERNNIAVLRRTNMPAILVETAFIDNKEDAELLDSKEHEFAKAIYNGIAELYNVESEEEEMTNEERAKFNELVNIVAKLQEKVDKQSATYNYIDKNMPEAFRATIQKLVDKGALKGDENGLNLNYDTMRILTILDRQGLFD